MNKQIVSTGKRGVSSEISPDAHHARVFCGIDVSAETLAVAVIELGQPLQQREFASSASGIAA